MPISTLKIDRSFVSMINEDGGNDEIVRAIVSLARTLNLKVVAEGIETASQLAKLKELGCESGQGFYFAAPMAFADLCEFLRQKDTFTLPNGPYDHLPEISAIQ